MIIEPVLPPADGNLQVPDEDDVSYKANIVGFTDAAQDYARRDTVCPFYRVAIRRVTPLQVEFPDASSRLHAAYRKKPFVSVSKLVVL